MNIIFFGSGNFAVPSLKALLKAGHKVLSVVTQPDRKSGRGLSLGQTPVKLAAEEAGLKVYQPRQINSLEPQEFLKNLKPDLFVVIAYGQILSQQILDIPKVLPINAHASLLPKYRGAAPINWAIIRGENATGITIIRMSQEMDAGDILSQKPVDIKDDDTAVTLEQRLSDSTAVLLADSLELIKNGKYTLTPQDKEEASFAPKLKKQDGLVDWGKSAADIYNLVRGCLGWPGAFTYYRGKVLKVYKALVLKFESSNVRMLPGEIREVSQEGITVAAGQDSGIVIKELQIEGKRIMTAREFIAGHKISAGEILGKK